MAEIAILKIKGTRELKKAFKELIARADRNTPNILRQAGLKGVGFCKLECPVDLGGLRASIGNPNKNGVFDVTRNSVIFGTAVHYAFHVELGTRPHIISPKAPPAGKGFLAWKDKKTKEWIYTKKPVHHPGTKGTHFMLKGVQKAVPGIIKILKGVLKGY